MNQRQVEPDEFTHGDGTLKTGVWEEGFTNGLNAKGYILTSMVNFWQRLSRWSTELQVIFLQIAWE